jgi:hypothetical protein
MMAMTKADLEKRVRELETQLESQHNGQVISYKVSQRGAVSVYGLGRFPVIMYQSQWEKLLSHQGDLKAFMNTNQVKLAVKKS